MTSLGLERSKSCYCLYILDKNVRSYLLLYAFVNMKKLGNQCNFLGINIYRHFERRIIAIGQNIEI